MASNPNTDLDKLITFGKMALEQGWYDQARDYFEQALALDASNREAMRELARVYERLGRGEAIEPVKPEVPVAKPAQPARPKVEPAKPRPAGKPAIKQKGKKRWLALAVIPVLLVVAILAYQRVQSTPTPQVDYARVYETQVAPREATPAARATPTPSKGKEYYDAWDAHTLAWNDAIDLGWKTQDGAIIAMAIQELQKLHREWQRVDPPRAYETFHEKTLIYEESVIDMYLAISRRASQSTVDELFDQVEENRRIAEEFMPYRFQYYANEK